MVFVTDLWSWIPNPAYVLSSTSNVARGEDPKQSPVLSKTKTSRSTLQPRKCKTNSNSTPRTPKVDVKSKSNKPNDARKPRNDERPRTKKPKRVYAQPDVDNLVERVSMLLTSVCTLFKPWKPQGKVCCLL